MNDRQEVLAILKDKLEPNIYSHSLALEACMAGLYDYFSNENALGPDEPSREDWVLAGLLHDVDYSGKYKDQHPSKTKEALEEYGIEISESVIHIIKAHAPWLTKTELKTKADWAIFLRR